MINELEKQVTGLGEHRGGAGWVACMRGWGELAAVREREREGSSGAPGSISTRGVSGRAKEDDG